MTISCDWLLYFSSLSKYFVNYELNKMHYVVPLLVCVQPPHAPWHCRLSCLGGCEEFAKCLSLRYIYIFSLSLVRMFKFMTDPKRTIEQEYLSKQVRPCQPRCFVCTFLALESLTAHIPYGSKHLDAQNHTASHSASFSLHLKINRFSKCYIFYLTPI